VQTENHVPVQRTSHIQ